MNSNTDVHLERPLPANLEAERFVLAEAMRNRQGAIANILAILQVEDFCTLAHRRTFAAIANLDAAGKLPADRVTIAEELEKHGFLESVGGLSYLLSIDDGLPEITNLDSYISIVKDKSTLRRAIHECEFAMRDCYMACDPTPEILERAERAIAALTTETRPVGLCTPLDIVKRAGGLSTFLEPDTRRGVATPWPGLNSFLVGRGFLPGQMIVIGARPSKGKTALACQIADYAATHDVGTAFFTLEMSSQSILTRMAAARAQVDSLKASQGWMTSLEKNALGEAFADLTNDVACKLWIDDTTGCTIPAMRAALRILSARHPVGLIVIDYLQLVEVSGGSERRRYEQVTELSRGMKRLAREFAAPVVVLAQLNRESEKDSRAPRPSDLRDSGSIEQDADVILMPHSNDGQDDAADVVAIDLLISKQRNGPLGRVPLKFLRRFAKFVEPLNLTPGAGSEAHRAA